MKRILYVLALLSATVLVSCEKSSGGGGGGGGGGASGGGGGTVTVDGTEPSTDQTPLWAVKNDYEHFGYMDAKGNVVVPIEYQAGRDFSSGLAIVKKDGSWYVIDQTGKEVGQIPSNLNSNNCYYYNRLRVWDKQTNLYGFLDENLDVAIPTEYASLGAVGSNGLAWASKNKTKWGFVDRNGKEVIPEQYDVCYRFMGTATRVGMIDGVDTLYGIIDGTGKYLVEPQAMYLNPLGEDVFAFYDGSHWGVWDKNGNELAPAVYDAFWGFHDGLACFEKDDMYGFMNTKGTELFPATFYNCLDFYGGYCWVQKADGDPWEWIDKDGKVVYTLTTNEYICDEWLRNELTVLGILEDASTNKYAYRYIDIQGNTLASWIEYHPNSGSSAPMRMGTRNQRRAPREDESSMSN